MNGDEVTWRRWILHHAYKRLPTRLVDWLRGIRR